MPSPPSRNGSNPSQQLQSKDASLLVGLDGDSAQPAQDGNPDGRDLATNMNGTFDSGRRDSIQNLATNLPQDKSHDIDADHESAGSDTGALTIMPYWTAKRHTSAGHPTPPPAWMAKATPWRSSPVRLRTSHVLLVQCLKIGALPPDIVPTDPRAVLECWVDPASIFDSESQKALEIINTKLRGQFDTLKAKNQQLQYFDLPDPTMAYFRRVCVTARREAGRDAIVFYYNGHGVLKPTIDGELWCFNEDRTEYSAVSISKLQLWLNSPCVYIWDCAAAGRLLSGFIHSAQENDKINAMVPNPPRPFADCLQLAACAADEQLPSCPELPADVLTSCLTSPIQMALHYFILRNNLVLPVGVTIDSVKELPGDASNRQTPLGELEWIFIAITDAIAWTSLPPDVFNRLYRADKIVSSLFRNYLLAERILKDYGCTPHTYPPIPSMNTHPLWDTWDLAVDACLRQLPDLLKNPERTPDPSAIPRDPYSRAQLRDVLHPRADLYEPYEYKPTRFFADTLTAFEVWISHGGIAPKAPSFLSSSHHTYSNTDTILDLASRTGDLSVPLIPRPPEHLPIVMQALMTHRHRLRTLILLAQFMDLGSWAVHHVLRAGFFGPLMNLLRPVTPREDLQPVLIFIWARILAVDPTCQVDLYNGQVTRYFSNVLRMPDDQLRAIIPNISEHKAMCAFILAIIARGFLQGQNACFREQVFHACFQCLDANDYLLRQWSALCIAQLWATNDEIKAFGVDHGTQDKLIASLLDDSPEVRTAAVFALGTFLGASGFAQPSQSDNVGTGAMLHLEERVHCRMEAAVATSAMLAIKDDASPMARKELVVLISCLVNEWKGHFIVCAWLYWEEDRQWRSVSPEKKPSTRKTLSKLAVQEWLEGCGDDEILREQNRVLLSSIFTIFSTLLELYVDPYQEVATLAKTVVDYAMALLLDSPFTKLETSSLKPPPKPYDRPASGLGRRNSVQSPQSLARFSSPSLLRSTTGVPTSKEPSNLTQALRKMTLPIVTTGRSSPTLSSSSRSSHSPLSSCPPPLRPPSPNFDFTRYVSPYADDPASSSSSDLDSDSPPSPTSSLRSSSPHTHPQPPFYPSDVIEALIEEDMERLRTRRRKGQRQQTSEGTSPSESSSSEGSNASSSVILGLGTGTGLRNMLPLKSTYFESCCDYFREPQMRQAEANEPGSIEYNHQSWRLQRNEQMIVQTAAQAEVATEHKWDKTVTNFRVSGAPLLMAFHSFDPHIVVANGTDTVSVWDWSRRQQLVSFMNGNPQGTVITSLRIINQEIGGIILVASADGIIRLYRNYDPATSNAPVQLVSAFRALSEIIRPVPHGVGTIVDWQQLTGHLHVSGDSRMIRIWDAHNEMQVMDLTTSSGSPVTTIASENHHPSLLVTGFGDGSIKVFDKRLREDKAVVHEYIRHASWVENARWSPTHDRQFLSASLDGAVHLWDIRRSEKSVGTWNPVAGGLSAFDVHPNSGVFAASSVVSPSNWRNIRTAVHAISSNTRPLSSVTIPSGISPITNPRPLPTFGPRAHSLAFHPLEMVYGIGSPDGTVRILGCKLS